MSKSTNQEVEQLNQQPLDENELDQVTGGNGFSANEVDPNDPDPNKYR